MTRISGNKKINQIAIIFIVLIFLGFAGYGSNDSHKKENSKNIEVKVTKSAETSEAKSTETSEAKSTEIKETETSLETETETTTEEIEITTPNLQTEKFIELKEIPAYSGNSYVVINNNVPFFTEKEITTQSFEYYSDLDSLGRCGVAYANISKEIMPTEERGKIGSVKPSGWHSVKYENVDGNYLYNRCHLIGYQLAGENANEKNLITGTRYLNIDGMLPFENMVADYVKETNTHVLYRVTPMFDGKNLLASGVLMEAMSVEDRGKGILFNVYCYNAQPGIQIDYLTGDSFLIEPQTEAPTKAPAPTEVPTGAPAPTEAPTQPAVNPITSTYMVNTNTRKFHVMSCSSIKQMSDKNKWEFTGTRDELIANGYEPCQRCNP